LISFLETERQRVRVYVCIETWACVLSMCVCVCMCVYVCVCVCEYDNMLSSRRKFVHVRTKTCVRVQTDRQTIAILESHTTCVWFRTTFTTTVDVFVTNRNRTLFYLILSVCVHLLRSTHARWCTYSGESGSILRTPLRT